MIPQEVLDEIADAIMAMDLSEAKEISSDWYAASLRTRMACAALVKGFSTDSKWDRKVGDDCRCC